MDMVATCVPTSRAQTVSNTTSMATSTSFPATAPSTGSGSSLTASGRAGTDVWVDSVNASAVTDTEATEK